LSGVILLIALAAPAAAQPLSPPPDTIAVFLDQARLIQLPDRAANVVIGNPLIADVSIQPGGLTVITGKSYGMTNFIVTDRQGVVLADKAIEVSAPNERTVFVYEGSERHTYSCAPQCSRRLMLGDSPTFFDSTMTEITALNAQATAAGALTSGDIKLDSSSVGTGQKQNGR